jgi:hypothetical protein
MNLNMRMRVGIVSKGVEQRRSGVMKDFQTTPLLHCSQGRAECETRP